MIKLVLVALNNQLDSWGWLTKSLMSHLLNIRSGLASRSHLIDAKDLMMVFLDCTFVPALLITARSNHFWRGARILLLFRCGFPFEFHTYMVLLVRGHPILRSWPFLSGSLSILISGQLYSTRDLISICVLEQVVDRCFAARSGWWNILNLLRSHCLVNYGRSINCRNLHDFPSWVFFFSIRVLPILILKSVSLTVSIVMMVSLH
jgi:hypothetical protein